MYEIGSCIADRFEIRSCRGKGSFGTVYCATDRQRGRPVALKVLDAGIRSRSLEGLARFRRDAAVLAGLRHRHIAEFVDLRETEGAHVLVSEWLDGAPLGRPAPRAAGPQDVLPAVRVILQIAEGLAHAHRRGILHRDIKPSNIMLVHTHGEPGPPAGPGPGQAKILDFGVARLVDLARLAEREGSPGTFFYMAPEQAGLLRQPVDQRADLYSLGILAYEMLGGRRPYTGDEPGMVLQQHLTTAPLPLAELNPAVPEPLARVVGRLMAKSPDERYPSAGSLLADLRALEHPLAPAPPASPDPAAGPGPSEGIRVRAGLVERSRELAELTHCFEEVRRGRGQFCTVAGEAGIGKTRLVEELGKHVLPRQGIFLYGKCDEFGSKNPYHPFGALLDELPGKYRTWPGRRAELVRRVKEGLSPDHLGPLFQLSPGLGALLAGPVPAADAAEGEGPAWDAECFVEALSRFFCRLATPESPLVLVLDDLQWGQEESLRVLLRLAEHLDRAPALLVGAYREEAIQARPELLKVLHKVRGLPLGGRAIRLQPLSQEGVRSLTRERTGISGAGYRPLYDALHHITRGTPFLVLETLNALREREILCLEPATNRWLYHADRLTADAVPGNLLELIVKRVEKLSAESRRVLAHAAAIGRRFDFELLLSATGVPEDVLLDPLDEMVQLQLVEEVHNGVRGGYQFFHDQVREAVYGQIPAEEKRGIHERIARELEGRAGEKDPERDPFLLAYHYANGLDRSRALRYALAAGEKAHRQSAIREAAVYYALALERLGAPDGETRSRVQERLGDLYTTLGEYALARAAYEKVDCPETDVVPRARLERKIATVLYKNDPAGAADAARHLEKALALLGRRPRPGRLGTFLRLLFHIPHAMLGWPLAFSRKSRRCPAVRDRFVELARIYREFFYVLYYLNDISRSFLANQLFMMNAGKSGVPSLMAEVYAEYVVWLLNVRRFGKAFRFARKSIEIHREERNGLGAAYATCNLGMLELYSGRLDDAARHIQAAYPELERAGDMWQLIQASLHLAGVCYARGDLQTALGCLEKTRETLGEREGFLPATLDAVFGATYALMRDAGKAAFHVERLKAVCERSPNPVFQFNLHLVEGLAKAMQQEWGAASQSLERAVHIAGENWYYPVQTLPAFLLLARASLSLACDPRLDPSQREHALQRARKVLGKTRRLLVRLPCETGQWWILRGVYLWIRGRKGRARRAFQQGTSILERIGARLFLATGHEAMGMAFAASGHGEEAARHGGMALALLEEIGFLRDQTHAVEPQPEGAQDRDRVAEQPVLGDEPALSSEGRDLSYLIEASRLVTTSLELPQVLDRIMDLSLASLAAERGFLLLSEAGRPDTAIDRNLDPEARGQAAFSPSREILGAVRERRQPVVIKDARQDPRFAGPEGARAQAPRSVLCVPLLDRDRFMGLIYLDNRLVSHLFTEQNLRLLESLASFAVNAIKNARAYAEIRRQRDEIEALKERLQHEVVYLTEEIQAEHNFDEIVGAGAAMKELFRFIERAAELDQPVLILGETGTGKELVARAIHRHSARGAKPMIKVNCAAIPEGLLESELFGHEKGAFTGAVRTKIGRFELAAGGTLFLDEIGEMSPGLQAKLLRALEDKEFERVGGTKTLKVQLCVISATNRNLAEEIRQGRFREDLYYRLNVLPVRVPPLRERPEDIPLLLTHFIGRCNKKFNRSVRDVDRPSLEAALSYPWPGNVREMEHLVERAMALSDSSCLKLTHMLKLGPREEDPAGARPCARGPGPDLLAGNYEDSVQAARRRIVEEALSRAGGSKKEAARLLGVSSSGLSNLLKRLQIQA